MQKKRKSYWSVSEIGPSPPPLKVDADADADAAADDADDDGRVGIWKDPLPGGTAELKSLSWRQNVRYDVKKFIMTLKTLHDVKHFVITSKTRHGVNWFVMVLNHVMTSRSASWRQRVRHDVKTRHDVKNTSCHQKVCHYIKKCGMTVKKVCHDVKKCVMT